LNDHGFNQKWSDAARNALPQRTEAAQIEERVARESAGLVCEHCKANVPVRVDFVNNGRVFRHVVSSTLTLCQAGAIRDHYGLFD
jgi:trehalose-6-phosphatase